MVVAARRGSIPAAALAIAIAIASPAAAQDIGFGLADSYRYYADPGNGGGSAYAPFFDPYRGNRIVRGAYPDAYYDGYGYHYGKSAPPSLYVTPPPYLDRGDGPPLRVGETETAPLVRPLERDEAIVQRHRGTCRRSAARHGPSRICLARQR